MKIFELLWGVCYSSLTGKIQPNYGRRVKDMNYNKQSKIILQISRILLILVLVAYGDALLFIVASQLVFWIMILRASRIQSKKRFKFYLIFLYMLLVIAQTIFFTRYMHEISSFTLADILNNALGIFVVSLPYLMEYIVTVQKYTEFYLPSAKDFNTLSFAQLHDVNEIIKERLDDVGQLRKTLTPERLFAIAGEFPRHSSIQYLNGGSLTDAYFTEAEDSLSDPHIYIVVSNTGSAASEVISAFTRKQYNHASLSFDMDLKTIISYNGGEKIYPPGLNREMIEFFNKKDDASLIVYELDVTREQKIKLIDKLKEINKNGSAYNMLGLVIKKSLRPNIMFCSQFVYNMLKHVGLEYFDKADGRVKPTDLVELDYHRKLKFCYEIYLNNNVEGLELKKA